MPRYPGASRRTVVRRACSGRRPYGCWQREQPSHHTRAMEDLQAPGARLLIVDLRDDGGGPDDAGLAL